MAMQSEPTESAKANFTWNTTDATEASLDLLFPKRHQQAKISDPDDKILRFFVIGDWGAFDHYRELSSATDALNDLASKHEYDHIVTVGDNIYYNGVEDIDNRWKAWLCLTVFKKSALRHILIYPTLGNHDCYVNMYNEVKLSQYDYQWRMLENYYVKVTPLKDDPKKFFVNFMLNSCMTICPKGNVYQDDNYECTRFGLLPGGNEVQAHFAWIEANFARYSNDPDVAWMAVSLHHQPFIHPGEKLYLIPLMRKYGVEIIFTGHEHWNEYSNQEFDYTMRLPNKEYGDIVLNCKGNEIFTTVTREIHFDYGVKFHQITAGTAGAIWIDPTCPVRDMDVNLVYRSSNVITGGLSVEVNTTQFKASFINNDGTVGYTLYLHKKQH